MKIIIPKGSIIQLPKQNTGGSLFELQCDMTVDSEDIEIIQIEQEKKNVPDEIR